MKNSFVSAKNREQKDLILSIINNPITFVTGTAGVGKSFCTIGLALEHLLKGKCDKFVLSRPLICMGKALPKKQAFRLEEDGRIEYSPLELMRGTNLSRTYLLLTEAQNATYEQLKMLLTRIGDDESRIILDGDIEQTDIKICHMKTVMDKIEHLEEVGNVELLESMRHPVVQKIARLL